MSAEWTRMWGGSPGHVFQATVVNTAPLPPLSHGCRTTRVARLTGSRPALRRCKTCLADDNNHIMSYSLLRRGELAVCDYNLELNGTYKVNNSGLMSGGRYGVV